MKTKLIACCSKPWNVKTSKSHESKRSKEKEEKKREQKEEKREKKQNKSFHFLFRKRNKDNYLWFQTALRKENEEKRERGERNMTERNKDMHVKLPVVPNPDTSKHHIGMNKDKDKGNGRKNFSLFFCLILFFSSKLLHFFILNVILKKKLPMILLKVN